LKVSLIIPSFYPAIVYGGPIYTTLNTSKELAKIDGVQVYVSTTNSNMTSKLAVETGTFIELEEDLFVKYYNETFVGRFSLSLFFNIWKDISIADVVHVQAIFNTPVPLSIFIARVIGRPVVLSPRGSLGGWAMSHGSKFKKLWLRVLIKPFANDVVWHATSELEKEEILVNFPAAKVVIIPNGIHVYEFKNTVRFEKIDYLKKYSGNDAASVDKVLISMGRLQKKKGFDILIDAFVEVLKAYSESYLFIAGHDEGERANLEDQIKRLGLSRRVYLIGNIQGQEKLKFLANADLFVLPSHNENFGNVYLESLACGTPIVASKGTPWRDVEYYECGMWVDNSVNETSRAMIKMLGMDRALIKKNGLKLAKKYDWINVAEQFEVLFKRVMDRKI